MTDYIIKVERRTKKTASSQILESQLQRSARIALKGSRGRGWSCIRIRVSRQRVENQNVIFGSVTFRPTTKRTSVAEKWSSIVTRFALSASSGGMAKTPWVVTSPEGYENPAKTIDPGVFIAAKNEPKKLGEVNLDVGSHFDHIYDRGDQIERVMGSLRLGQQTGWLKRVNCLLSGPPGGAKSEILKAIAAMLGKENEAWMKFDATAMSKAGVIEELMASPTVPPVLMIEEIEKAPEEALHWLLGVTDHRGEVRRINYRVGNEARNVRQLVIVTCNKVAKLRKFMDEALYSRLQNRIHFPPPDRELMKRILMREVLEINGDPAWVEPTLKFGFDKWMITDPRSLIAFVQISGKEVMDGTAQNRHERTMSPEDRRRSMMRIRKTKRKLTDTK